MNYHTKQQKVENQYKKQLIAIFLVLFQELDRLYPLTIESINATIHRWLMVNEGRLKNATAENIRDLSIIADSVVIQYVHNDVLENRLINANTFLIMQELDRIQQQYNILSKQSTTYGTTPTVRKERTDQIQSSAENSLKLLAENQSILNTREIMFETAAGQGYHEYLASTQQDDKVRPDHTHYYQDKWIEFDNPPPIGHIGTQINCRCFAVDFR